MQIYLKQTRIFAYWVGIFIIGFSLAGCDVKNTPIPFQDNPLVGVWEAEKREQQNGLLQIQRMYVEFTEEGYVAFQRVNCWAELASNESVNNKLQWHMKDFKIDFMPVIKLTKVKVKAQWMPLTPKIEMKLDSWPEEKDGQRKMTIDCMELVAVDTPTDRNLWACELLADQQ